MRQRLGEDRVDLDGDLFRSWSDVAVNGGFLAFVCIESRSLCDKSAVLTGKLPSDEGGCVPQSGIPPEFGCN
jgi:hypothetical protein